jgi:hypothetical protein
MPEFSTGYFLCGNETRFDKVLKGKNFNIIFKEAPEGKEVIIETETFTTATKVSRLILDSLCLLDSCPISEEYPLVNILNATVKQSGALQSLSCPRIIDACLIACCASFRIS